VDVAVSATLKKCKVSSRGKLCITRSIYLFCHTGVGDCVVMSLRRSNSDWSNLLSSRIHEIATTPERRLAMTILHCDTVPPLKEDNNEGPSKGDTKRRPLQRGTWCKDQGQRQKVQVQRSLSSSKCPCPPPLVEVVVGIAPRAIRILPLAPSRGGHEKEAPHQRGRQ